MGLSCDQEVLGANNMPQLPAPTRLTETSEPVALPTESYEEMQPEIQLIPVHKDDFKKINEFAEAAWICRDPDNSENIRDLRRELLKEHNPEIVRNLQEKEKKRKHSD